LEVIAGSVVSAGFQAGGDTSRPECNKSEERAMKQIQTMLGGMALAAALAVAGCSGSGGGEIVIAETPTPTASPRPTPKPTGTPIPSATPTPVLTTDFVGFVHKLFAETSDTTQPEDINDLDFSNLDAGPNAFDDLLK
jgi:hypothetical protein